MQPATTSAQANQNLQTYANGMQTPDAELQSANQSLGVNQAQQTVQGLQGAINNTTNLLNQVAPSVEGRTQNSLVTSAQSTKQISNEEAPLQSDLSQSEQQYDTANSAYTNLETQAENEANSNEQAQQNQLSYLQSVYNDLYTQEQNTAAQQEQAKQDQMQQSEFSQQLAEEEQAANAQGDASDAELEALMGGNSTATASQPSTKSSLPSLGSIITAKPTTTKKSSSSGGGGLADILKPFTNFAAGLGSVF
jgi:chromosome segregation ATPase